MKAWPGIQRRKVAEKMALSDGASESEGEPGADPWWMLIRPSVEDHDPDDPKLLPDAVREALLAEGYAPVDGSDESGEVGGGGYPIERRPGSAGDDYAGWFVFRKQ